MYINIQEARNSGLDITVEKVKGEDHLVIHPNGSKELKSIKRMHVELMDSFDHSPREAEMLMDEVHGIVHTSIITRALRNLDRSQP